MRPNPYPSICHRLLQHSCPVTGGGDNVNTLLVMVLHQYLHDAFMRVSVIPLLKSRLRGDPRDSSQDGLITITTIVLQSYCAPVPPPTPPKFLFRPRVVYMIIARSQEPNVYTVIKRLYRKPSHAEAMTHVHHSPARERPQTALSTRCSYTTFWFSTVTMFTFLF